MVHGRFPFEKFRSRKNRTMPPPPLPSRKIPRWIWALTIGGVLFIVLLYGAIFGGFLWIMDKARTEMAASNPEFEMLSIGTDGKIHIRHKRSGKEFALDSDDVKKRIPVRLLATKVSMTPTPEWLKLPGAVAGTHGTWEMPADKADVADQLDGVLRDHEFEIEEFRDSTMIACRAQSLRCVKIAYGDTAAAGRAWYSVSLTEAP